MIELGEGRGFFFGTADDREEVERFAVFLEGANVERLRERPIEGAAREEEPRRRRYYLVPVAEGESTEGALAREADRLRRFFAVDRELSRMTARGEGVAGRSFEDLLREEGFRPTGEECAPPSPPTGSWRLERAGRIPAVISSRPEDLPRTGRTVNLCYVAPEILSGAEAPTKTLLRAHLRFVARLDRPPEEVRRRGAALGLVEEIP